VPGNRSKEACLDAAHLSVIQKVGKARTVMAGAASAVSASAVAPIKGKKKGEGPRVCKVARLGDRKKLSESEEETP
jgi:hypothetical protein